MKTDKEESKMQIIHTQKRYTLNTNCSYLIGQWGQNSNQDGDTILTLFLLCGWSKVSIQDTFNVHTRKNRSRRNKLIWVQKQNKNEKSIIGRYFTCYFGVLLLKLPSPSNEEAALWKGNCLVSLDTR